MQTDLVCSCGQPCENESSSAGIRGNKRQNRNWVYVLAKRKTKRQNSKRSRVGIENSLTIVTVNEKRNVQQEPSSDMRR